MLAALEVLATLPGRPVAVLGRDARARDPPTTPATARSARAAAARRRGARGRRPGGRRDRRGRAAEAGLAPDRIHPVADREAAARASCGTVLRPGDAVLVKASRGAALEIDRGGPGGRRGDARRRVRAGEGRR